MASTDWRKGTYTVWIRREGELFVARNAKGEWVTKGKYKTGMTNQEIAEWLFHADEIESVKHGGGVYGLGIEVKIWTANESECE